MRLATIFKGGIKMVTIRGKYLYQGLSTDVKPTTESTPNGAGFTEIDTGKGFLYDAEGKKWWEIPAGSSVVINPAQGEDF